jgi:hypothetical protein
MPMVAATVTVRPAKMPDCHKRMRRACAESNSGVGSGYGIDSAERYKKQNATVHSPSARKTMLAMRMNCSLTIKLRGRL